MLDESSSSTPMVSNLCAKKITDHKMSSTTLKIHGRRPIHLANRSPMYPQDIPDIELFMVDKTAHARLLDASEHVLNRFK